MTHAKSGLFMCPPPIINVMPAPPAPVPLLGVSVEAELTGASVRVALSQRFKNVEATAIEAVYLFPLPTDAAVCGFEADVDGRRVEGRVEERDKAFEIYDDAMAEGHGAFLMDQERPNVFTLSVGNLKPGSEATIRLTWVATVPWEGEALRFMLPTTVSPRYAPASPVVEIGQPDADKLAPERLAKVPYGLTFSLRVNGPVKRIESPTHPIRTTLGTPVTVELSQAAVALDRDVVIVVEPADVKVPTAAAAKDESGTRYVQIGFVPDMDRVAGGAEVVFLVDCSGSMGGDSIAEARRALELCVRALGLEDSFDIVRFGSSFDALFGAARAFDDASLSAATAYVRATDANLGGTEILAPLRAILERPLAAGRTRQVMLLTDGQVSNEADVIELAKQHALHARVFAFGIGAGVSEHLVREVARASRGEVELIAPGERIEPKVLRQFGRVRSPALSDVKVDWGGLEVEQAPKVVPPVFDGELLTVWAKVRAGAANEVMLSAGGRTWRVPVDLERAAQGGPVPALWGRAAIRDIESGQGRHGSSQQRPGKADRKNDQLVEIGKALGLVSSATSYVAVELRAEADRTTGPAELRRVPIALTSGWGGRQGAGLAGGAVPASAPAGMAYGGPMAMPAPAPARRKAGAVSTMVNAVARRASGVVGAMKDAFAPPEPMEMRAEPEGRQRVMPVKALEAADHLFQDADELYALLLTQTAVGGFPASAVKAYIKDAAAFAALAARHGDVKVATAVVLAVLARDFADRAFEWRAAAEKAQRFLAGVLIDVDDLL